jgi:polysaccharide chain length determinant protein (PEP-CTERM system associated)
MLGHRELTMQDYGEILRRRFWLILICAVITLGIGVGLSHVLPPEFTSQTLIIIEQQKVPAEFVRPVVEEDLGERLATMKEQILSRSRVQPIVERFGLFARNGNTMDDRIALTQKAIGIKPIQSARGMPGFFISFKASDARTAQQVCGEITSLFVSGNLSQREQTAEGTTDFLKEQLEDAKRNLDDQDAKMAEFERKNIGKLPNAGVAVGNGMNIALGNPNESMLTSLSGQLNATTQSIERNEQNETLMQAMIAQQSQEADQAFAGNGVVSVDSMQDQLKKLIEQRKQLQLQYTSSYPDVVALTHQISDLQHEIAENAAHPAPAAPVAAVKHADPPQLVQAKAQLRALQDTVAQEKLQQNQIQQTMKEVQARIEATPQIEEEFKQITRDHQISVDAYNSLLGKMNESSMATALEHRQEGEQFHVMDAPNLPEEPTFPNRFVFAGGGFGGGVILGLIITCLLEYRDTALHNERDIFAFTKLPTLATVSFIDGLPQPTARRISWSPFSKKQSTAEGTNG